MVSYLPKQADLAALALDVLRKELIPNLPAELRYKALMTARSFDYALAVPVPEQDLLREAADLKQRVAGSDLNDPQTRTALHDALCAYVAKSKQAVSAPQPAPEKGPAQ